MDFPMPQQRKQARRQGAALVSWLLSDEAQIANFNTYAPATVALFILAFLLVTGGSIYGAVTLQGTQRDVVAGTGFSAWILMVVTAVLYGVSVAPPMPLSDSAY
jgi:hypothetical protein